VVDGSCRACFLTARTWPKRSMNQAVLWLNPTLEA
jgi:hypothetical protein